MPLPRIQSRNLELEGGVIGPHSDPFKALGFDGLERLGDLLYSWPPTLEHQVFEFRGSGQVKRTRRGQV